MTQIKSFASTESDTERTTTPYVGLHGGCVSPRVRHVLSKSLRPEPPDRNCDHITWTRDPSAAV
jgi:hypothetical protein